MAGSAAVSGLTDLTVVVGRRARLADVPGRPSGWCGSRTGGAGGSVEVATGDAVMEPGDRLRVVVPRGRMPEVTRFLGDTERRVNEGYATRSPGPVAGRPPSRFFDDRGRVGFGHD